MYKPALCAALFTALGAGPAPALAQDTFLSLFNQGISTQNLTAPPTSIAHHVAVSVSAPAVSASTRALPAPALDAPSITKIGRESMSALPAPEPSDTSGILTQISAYLIEGDRTTLLTRPPASGELIEYRAYITNTRQSRIKAVDVVLDIPHTVVFESAPFGTRASVDGATFAHLPLKTATSEGLAPVPHAYYRALQYQLEYIAQGGTAVASYRARVL